MEKKMEATTLYTVFIGVIWDLGFCSKQMHCLRGRVPAAARLTTS